VALASDDEQSEPGDDRDKREERRRSRVERGRHVVESAVRRTVHRTPSTLAEDVVSQALRGVGRQLLMTDDKVRQCDSQQSRYNTCSLA